MPGSPSEPLEQTPADTPTKAVDPTAFDSAVGIASLPLILNPEGTHIALVRLDRFIPLRTRKPREVKNFKGHLNAEGRTELKVWFWPRTDAKGFLFAGTCLLKIAGDAPPANEVMVLGTIQKIKLDETEEKGYLIVRVTPTQSKIQPFVVTFRASRELLEPLIKNQRVKVTAEVDEKQRLKARQVEVLENPPGA
jgi:hypothetical protein